MSPSVAASPSRPSTSGRRRRRGGRPRDAGPLARRRGAGRAGAAAHGGARRARRGGVRGAGGSRRAPRGARRRARVDRRAQGRGAGPGGAHRQRAARQSRRASPASCCWRPISARQDVRAEPIGVRCARRSAPACHARPCYREEEDHRRGGVASTTSRPAARPTTSSISLDGSPRQRGVRRRRLRAARRGLASPASPQPPLAGRSCQVAARRAAQRGGLRPRPLADRAGGCRRVPEELVASAGARPDALGRRVTLRTTRRT